MCEAIQSCIQGCAKVILVIINLITLTAAVVMVAVGAAALIKGDEFTQDYSVNLTAGAVFLIVLGSLLALIGLFGCFGACTGRHGLLNWYIGFILLIILLEVVALIYVFVNKSKINETAHESITESFNKVNIGNATETERSIVDSIQTALKCCGLDGPSSWNGSAFQNNTVPASCCSNSTEAETTCPAANAFTLECSHEAKDLIEGAQMLIIMVIIIVAIFQIICTALAHCSKSEYSDVSA